MIKGDKLLLKIIHFLVIFLLLFSFPSYAAPASGSNATETELEEWEEMEGLAELEEYINKEREAWEETLFYRLDLVVSLLSMLLGCLCACIFSMFWRFR